MDKELLEVFIIFFIAFCAGFMKVVSGFGKGITSQIMYWLFASLGLIIHPRLNQITLLIFCGIVPVSYINIRWVLQYAEKTFTAILFIGQVTGGLLGTYLLIQYASVWLERSLGLLFLAVLAFNIWSSTNRPPRGAGRTGEEVLQEVPWYAFLGVNIVAGVLAGMFGCGGPPMMAFGLLYDVKKELLTASTIFAFCFGTGPIAIIMLGIVEGGINKKTWPIVLAMFGGCLVGFGLGRIVSRYTRQANFRWMLRVLLFCGSVIIGTHGFGQATRIISFACGGILLLSVLLFVGISLVYQPDDDHEKIEEESLEQPEEEKRLLEGR